MDYSFIIEPTVYHAFEDETAQLEQCKHWGLLSEKATKTKSFYYKGNGLNETCAIIGYTDKITAVIQFDNEKRHCIHPAYLKEMQASTFGRRPQAATEQAEADASDNDSGIEEQTSIAVVAETETPLEAKKEQAVQAVPAAAEPSEHKAPVAETQAGQEVSAAETQAEHDAATVETQAERASDAVNPVSEEDGAKPKGKTSRKRGPQLELPEQKVKMTATVKEFTTVPNNFSDSDDEVVIYEAVSIADPALEVGDAWSSHSATLKKLELAIGDTITFEGKIVAKKLTKHPVAYKINNPAKLQKEAARP